MVTKKRKKVRLPEEPWQDKEDFCDICDDLIDFVDVGEHICPKCGAILLIQEGKE